jgi:hypothetical protein
MDLKETGLAAVELGVSDQDRAQWRAMVNTVVEVRGSLNSEEFLD